MDLAEGPAERGRSWSIVCDEIDAARDCDIPFVSPGADGPAC